MSTQYQSKGYDQPVRQNYRNDKYEGGYRGNSYRDDHNKTYPQRQGGYSQGQRSNYQGKHDRYDEYPSSRRQEAAKVSFYEEEDEEVEYSDEEEVLNEEQVRFIQQKQLFVKAKIPVLKASDVQQICIDFDFDEDRIDEYLKSYEIDEKYKDIPAFQWHTTQTKEEKQRERLRKIQEAERKRRAEERRIRIKQEREERMIERAKRQEKKAAEHEARKKKAEEQKAHREIQKLKRDLQTKDVYPVKHGEKTLVFKKKGEGETPTAPVEAESPEQATTSTAAKFQKLAKGAKKVAAAGMVWKAKKKEDTTEAQNAAPVSKQDETTTSHTVEVSHKPSEEPKLSESFDEEEKDNEELLRKAANASKEQYGYTPQKKEKETKEPVQKITEKVANISLAQEQPKQPASQPVKEFHPTPQVNQTRPAQAVPHQNVQPLQQPLPQQQQMPMAGAGLMGFPQMMIPNPMSPMTPEQQQMLYQQLLVQQQMIQQYQQQLLFQQQQFQMQGQKNGQQQQQFPAMPFGFPPQMPFMQPGVNPSGQPSMMMFPGAYPFQQYQTPQPSDKPDDKAQDAGKKKE